MTLPLAPGEVRDLIISTSTHQGKRRLSPVDVAALFAKATAGGASKKECAEIVGFADATMVGRFLRLLDLAPLLHDMIGWGRSDASLAFTAGAELARLPPTAHEFLAPEALRLGLTTAEVKSIVQRLLRSDVTASQAVAETLRLRPQIERRHVFVGRFGAGVPSQALSSLSEDERAQMLVEVVRDLYGEPPVGARLTPTGFVVTAADDLAAAMRASGDFEDNVGKAITARAR
jgi:hypothetical protein